MAAWLTVEEASERSGYVAEYLRRLIRDGKIFAKKKGTMYWVNTVSLDSYVKNAEDVSADDARFTARRRPS